MQRKIAIPTSETIEFINIGDIVRIEADRNNSKVFTIKAAPLTVTKSLTDFQKVLDEELFVRVHKSHLVNIEHIQRFVKIDCGYIEMIDGTKIAVSRRKKSSFDKAIENYVKQM
ncbi:MAG: LytTR family DNA-binding domain-containing protein [Bacteroidota bacterium]